MKSLTGKFKEKLPYISMWVHFQIPYSFKVYLPSGYQYNQNQMEKKDTITSVRNIANQTSTAKLL